MDAGCDNIFHHFKNKKQKGNIGHSMNIIFAFSNIIHLLLVLFILSFIHMSTHFYSAFTKHFRNDYC